MHQHSERIRRSSRTAEKAGSLAKHELRRMAALGLQWACRAPGKAFAGGIQPCNPAGLGPAACPFCTRRLPPLLGRPARAQRRQRRQANRRTAPSAPGPGRGTLQQSRAKRTECDACRGLTAPLCYRACCAAEHMTGARVCKLKAWPSHIAAAMSSVGSVSRALVQFDRLGALTSKQAWCSP